MAVDVREMEEIGSLLLDGLLRSLRSHIPQRERRKDRAKCSTSYLSWPRLINEVRLKPGIRVLNVVKQIETIFRPSARTRDRPVQ